MNNPESSSNLIENYLKVSQRNMHIKDALKELLLDIAENPIKYALEQKITPSTRHLVLKEISYVLTIAIKDFFIYVTTNDVCIISAHNAKSNLSHYIETELMRLRCEHDFWQNPPVILDSRLNKFYTTNEKVSDDPIIQFIFWSIKNIPRLCIDPKKDFLPFEVSDVLKDYFNNMFFAIKKYNNSGIKMKSSQIRNFLCSEFIDLLLLSEYYQQTFN